jgi:sugar phosphate isomerase/epimerase
MQEQKELLNVKACCEMANAINVPYVRVQIISYTYGPLPPIATSVAPGSAGGQVSSRSLENQFNQGMNTLTKAVDIAEDMGVILGLDNHYFFTVLDHLKIVKMINSPNLKLFMDVSNATLNGEDIVANAKACGKLLVHSHVKDRTVFGSKVSGAEFTGESLVPIGMGDVDWRRYLTALKEIGYEGYLSIEGNAVGFSTEETTKIGLEYLTDLRKRI